MWHSERMENPPIVEKPNKKQTLRCSFPPYYVGVVESGAVFASLPGENYELLERALAPSGAEVRAMLIHMRSKLLWSRPMLAAYMGISRDVVRRWEDGSRNPNGAARRLIWMLYQLAFHPTKLKSAVDVMFWGRPDEMRQCNPNVMARKRSLMAA
jgi:DNA-binding transcriptional regulator YiaG